MKLQTDKASGKARVRPPSGDLPQGDKTIVFMKYYVYILSSLKNSYLYIGSTGNLSNRVAFHNQGKVKSTKAYRPWELLEFKTFNTRSEAVKMERFLKTGQQKEILRKKYGHVAK